MVSTYELGHQPLCAATAAAALLGAGHEVRCVDVAVDTLDSADVDWAGRVALSVPMHTAMRLALRVVETIRARRPGLAMCFFGLYAGMSRELTVTSPADAIIAGEYEAGLVAWADGADPGAAVQLHRSEGRVPVRELLAELGRYTRLAVAGEERLVGSVAASRGCAHRCRHCPVPVVYDGRTRLVGVEPVVEDVAQLVAMGARHLTFGDPDFLNGPHHSLRVVRAVHQAFPELTFDCTVKVEHILRHQDLWAEMASAGCLFVVSALESVNDDILARLDKGHTAVEAAQAVAVLRQHGIDLRPSLLPFTPWTTMADMVDLMDFVALHDLVGSVDPVHYSIRLLLPEGSLLLDRPDVRTHLGPYDPAQLTWTWKPVDPALDDLQASLAAIAEQAAADGAPLGATYLEIRRAVLAAATGTAAGGAGGIPLVPVSTGPTEDRPRLTEAWFCCAEPTGAQLVGLE